MTDTITDEQIRDLRERILAVVPHFRLMQEERETVAICDVALNPACDEPRRRAARRVCAKAIERYRAILATCARESDGGSQ